MEKESHRLYAHTPNPDGNWHALADHLSAVSALSQGFADQFDAAELGRTLGLLHDVGKFNPDFQRYLRLCWEFQSNGGTRPRSAPHSIYGALTASRNNTPLLAFAAEGHHGEIKDPSALRQSLANAQSSGWISEAEATLCNELTAPDFPKWTSDPTACEFFVRMLFSCLVDADWLDTEAHFNRWKTEMRGNAVSMADLWQLFERDQQLLMDSISPNSDNPVNQARREIYKACASAGDNAQGVYRLTVPTGGGKTRSAMGFALRHAIHHGLNRIILAIPYTSIIDQNAQVYKRIFGEENVLEHHSSVDVPSDPNEEQSETELRRQLSAENWDMPIVVTTTVQLFESLFSNKPSRCRKLHNLANSVLVLDEVQTLPVGLLQPILDVLKELVEHYGVSLVLSTATQPAFSGESPYLKGFTSQLLELVPDPGQYFKSLKRVDYDIVTDNWSWERTANEMRQHDQVLCVLNSRKDALELFGLLDDSKALHLSTLMCPAHRRRVLAEITRRLAAGESCRVVSTQVVEAGVDLDFPVVFRAMGPLDRIVQAAGRCNREGKLDKGSVVVFTPEGGRAPKGVYGTAMAEAGITLSQPECDLHDPAVFDSYFQRLWQSANVDTNGICTLRQRLNFPETAKKFEMITEDTVPVVVRYGDPGPGNVLDAVRCNGHASRDDWRNLQAYTVSIFQGQFQRYLNDGVIDQVIEGLYVWAATYDERTGISEQFTDPADLIA